MNKESIPPAFTLAVNVTVDANDNITCSPETIPVPMGQGEAEIIWALGSAGWHFPTTGAITVTGTSKNFPRPATLIQPQIVSLRDCCVDSGDFSYTIKVSNASGKTISLDPVIKNNSAGGI
jgi:hypothetical protein